MVSAEHFAANLHKAGVNVDTILPGLLDVTENYAVQEVGWLVPWSL